GPVSDSFAKVLFDRWQAINESSLPSEEKDTLRALLFYFRDSDECFPGLARLARDLSVNKRTVSRRLRKLESLGVIRREQGQNQRLIRANWKSIYGGNPPSGDDTHVMVVDTKPRHRRQGG